MLIFLLILNFAISWFNAWACGKAWPETKHVGGWAHFMNWMGAIMSACGFTWCFLILLALLGTVVPYGSDADGASAFVVSPLMLKAVVELGYAVIILPIIGSGFAITIDSWAHFYRRRSFGSGAIAGYNTAAQIYNTYEAVSMLPGVLKDLYGMFVGGDSSDSSSSDSGGLKGFAIFVVIMLVVAALVGGILLTRGIIMATAKNNSVDRNLQFATADGEQAEYLPPGFDGRQRRASRYRRR